MKPHIYTSHGWITITLYRVGVPEFNLRELLYRIAWGTV